MVTEFSNSRRKESVCVALGTIILQMHNLCHVIIKKNVSLPTICQKTGVPVTVITVNGIPAVYRLVLIWIQTLSTVFGVHFSICGSTRPEYRPG